MVVVAMVVVVVVVVVERLVIDFAIVIIIENFLVPIINKAKISLDFAKQLTPPHNHHHHMMIDWFSILTTSIPIDSLRP